MKNVKDKYLRFVGLRLRDYKVFGGMNDFWFNRHQTVIVGKGGTGKTVITEALEHLGPPARTGRALTLNGRAASYIAVITDGNCELIDQYRSLIFLSGESADSLAMYSQSPVFEYVAANGSRKAIASKVRTNFGKILRHKPWKIDLHRDLSPGIMAGGERLCFGYAFAFAVREALKLDVPVVLDSPYARLDPGLREGLHDFLKTQPCQQILLGHECEFTDKELPKYILVYLEEYSRVMEF